MKNNKKVNKMGMNATHISISRIKKARISHWECQSCTCKDEHYNKVRPPAISILVQHSPQEELKQFSILQRAIRAARPVRQIRWQSERSHRLFDHLCNYQRRSVLPVRLISGHPLYAEQARQPRTVWLMVDMDDTAVVYQHRISKRIKTNRCLIDKDYLSI